MTAYKKLFFTSVMLFSNLAFGDESLCPTKDYTKRLSPVKYQGLMGWCGSYVASDLMEFYSNNKIRVSPVSIAMSTNSKTAEAKPYVLPNGFVCPLRFPTTQAELIQAGFIANAFNAAQETGFCHEPKEAEDKKFVQKIFDQMVQIRSSVSTMSEQKLKLSQLVSSACSNKLDELKFKELQGAYGQPNPELVQKAKHILSQGEMVGISIDLDILLDKNLRNLRDNGYTKREVNFCATNGHAVSIVGQKWNSKKNKCEFKIRNSWGKNSCSQIIAAGLKCKDGYIFLDEEILSRVIYGITVKEI